MSLASYLEEYRERRDVEMASNRNKHETTETNIPGSLPAIHPNFCTAQYNTTTSFANHGVRQAKKELAGHERCWGGNDGDYGTYQADTAAQSGNLI